MLKPYYARDMGGASNSVPQRVNVGPVMMVDSVISDSVVLEAGLNVDGDIKAPDGPVYHVW